MKNNSLIYNNQILWCAILIGLATLLSFFPVLVLQDGGSWTFFSLLPLWLITYFYGFSTGMVWSFLFCFLKLATTYFTEGFSEPVSIEIFILEYVLACTLFCIGGLLPSNLRSQHYIASIKAKRYEKAIQIKEWHSKKEFTIDDYAPLPTEILVDETYENDKLGLSLGYFIGVLCMLICYVTAAYLYYPDSTYPAGVTMPLDKLIYDIKYDASYLLTEAFTTILILQIPVVYETIFKLKHIANNPKYDRSVNSF